MLKTTILTRSVVAVVAVAALVLPMASPAWAAGVHGGHGGGGGGGGGATTTGIDVSYPQCSDSLPSGEAFAIVGVNGGLANDYNTCLGSEFAYAQTLTPTTMQPKAQAYLNTADPGNSVADWPSPAQLGDYGSRTTPSGASCGYASGSSGPGANSAACAYVYGYDMVQGISYASGTVAGDVLDFHTSTGMQLYDVPTWLDVETANSWQAETGMNVADLQGMVDAIKAAAGTAGAQPIGVYSTSYQWGQITGTPSGSVAGNLAGLPDWIPGARGESGAASNCSLSSFTSGKVAVTQWFGHPYDGDYSCP